MSGIPQLAGLLSPKEIKLETNYDVIMKYYLEHRLDELPEDLSRMLERWRLAKAKMMDGELIQEGKNKTTRPYNYERLVDFLVETFKISVRTAREDIANAKRFWSTAQTKDDKDFARAQMIEWGQRFMFEAQGKGDFKSAAAFFKALSDIQGLNREDIDAPAYDQVFLPHLAIVADPSELGDAFQKVENADKLVDEILARRKKSKLDKLIADSDVVQEENNDAGS